MTYRSPDHVVVRFAGPDAAAFLQSQLTNDVAALAVGGWQWQGYCSAKGRLLATFALAMPAESTFFAIVPESTSEALIKRLILYRLRSKVEISRAVDQVVLFQEASDAQNSPWTGGGIELRLPDGRCWIVRSEADADGIPHATDAVRTRWALANIQAELPEITAATSDLFVPQMIGWDRVAPGGGVSFSKGCYPGQEVVARAHYRGAVKRRLLRATLSVPAGEVPAPGETVTLLDQRVADVCNIVSTATTSSDAAICEALVVVANAD